MLHVHVLRLWLGIKLAANRPLLLPGAVCFGATAAGGRAGLGSMMQLRAGLPDAPAWVWGSRLGRCLFNLLAWTLANLR